MFSITGHFFAGLKLVGRKMPQISVALSRPLAVNTSGALNDEADNDGADRQMAG
jgi:hypothetical protein